MGSYNMDLDTTQRFYEEIHKIRRSAGGDYAETVKTVYRYKDKYGLSCKEIIDVLRTDIEKLEMELI